MRSLTPEERAAYPDQYISKLADARAALERVVKAIPIQVGCDCETCEAIHNARRCLEGVQPTTSRSDG